MIGSLIHRAVQGEKNTRPPFWFMRQAGRYLPEYRELRKSVGGFLALCYNPELASEVTVQPIKRFDMDAAIVFSDILVVPHAMGVNVWFEEGEGPKLSAVSTMKQMEALNTDVTVKLETIANTLRLTRKKLGSDKSLIGFCGAPWTVACYMIEGAGRCDFSSVRKFAQDNEKIFSVLIDKLVAASETYLCMQIDAGADLLQIFDSWAGVLSPEEYDKWVIKPTQKLVAAVKARKPHVPIIGFARGSGEKFIPYAQKTGIDVVGIDTETPIEWASEFISLPIQGNLDPLVLAGDKHAAVKQTRHILQITKNRPFIFNLGHGIVPSTPLENVAAVCAEIFAHGKNETI